jgi:[ribosomal protein S18]-alanine N-acetyltransferase
LKPNSPFSLSGYTVRVCTADDLGDLAAIENESHAAPWTKPLLLDAISGENKHGLAAIGASGAVAGFCCYQTILDESELHTIAVGPIYRRHGIASLLLEQLFGRLQALGIKRLFLEVRESNQPALGLYRKKGFLQESVRKEYYGDGETAIVMVKTL